MTDDRTDEDFEMDRRTFLKSAGALGISASAIDFISEDEAQIGDITYNPKEEVPYVAGWDYITDDEGKLTEKEPFYEIIGRETWQKQKTTDDAKEQLQDMLGEFDEPIYTAITSDENSPTEERIDVLVEKDAKYSVQDVQKELPEEIRGTPEKLNVPLEVKEVDIEEEYCDYEGESYTYLPGGAPINGYPDIYVKPGTTTAAYSHPSYGEGWATAAHIVEKNGVNVKHDLGEEGDTDSPTDFIGESAVHVLDSGNNFWIDVAFIEDLSDEEPIPTIASHNYDNNTKIDVNGIVSNETIRRKNGNIDFGVHKQGRATCRHLSHITRVFEDPDGNTVGLTLGDYNFTENGDSGGPYFHYQDDGAYLVGVHKGSYSGGGAYGTTAETTEAELGGNFIANGSREVI